MNKILLSFLSLYFLFTSFATAQSSANNLQSNQTVEIRYESPAWNKDNNKVESYRVVARDSESGKSVLVTLTETAAASGVFTGIFRFDFGNIVDQNGYRLEVYILPTKTPIGNENDLHKFLKQDVLLKKFYFAYQEKEIAHIQLFDTNEQVVDAYRQRDLVLAQQTHMSNTTLAIAAEDQHLKLLSEAKHKAQVDSEQRKKMEEQEQERLIRLTQEQAALKQQERDKRKVQAKTFADQALSLYNKKNFSEAGRLFEKAYTLDPENSTYLYQYGICLYKLEKYNQSLSVLDLANDPSVNVVEKQYYRGLDLMKMKDFDKSWTEFNAVQNAQDPNLSPAAAFFAGVIDFQTETFDRAKTEFEYVLDNSKDPKMDAQAESYIDQVANAKAFLEKRSKPWTTYVAGGMMYDSNILNIANGNSATNQAGMRANYQGTAEYRFYYRQDREWTVYFGGSDMYSMTSSFVPNATLQSQDPLQAFLYLPYRWRGALWGTPGQLSISAGYEVINMDPYQTGSRNPILNSWVERTDWTYQAREDRLVNHELELRRDISLLPSLSADNLSAYKATYTWTNTFFQDRKKESAWVYDAILADNAGDGSNQAYYQAGAAGTYVTPWKWSSSVSGKLGVSYSTFPQNVSSRTDWNYNFTGGFRKPLTKTLATVLSASYLANNSTLGPYAYNKYTLGLSLAWMTDF
jgi:tetratricopeptide (TPR) repeat protein